MLPPYLTPLLHSLSHHSKDHALAPREAASGLLGSISLACWLFLLLPQLLENYRNGSAEAISLAFIVVWFVGDVCNLAGALWAGLVPVVVAIAIYFCIADGVLIGQVVYYGIRNKRREGKRMLAEGGSGGRSVVGGLAEATEVVRDMAARGEEEPLLLSRERTRSSITIPGSQDISPAAKRRRSSAASARRRASSGAQQEPLVKILEETDESGRLWARNLMSILAIITVGAAGWAVAYESGVWRPAPPESDVGVEEMAAGAQVLGYASAVLYLGARIPQIIKNAREKSCEGLSLLFFILSLLGNLTYGAGILAHSTEKDYFLKNLPWLIGSLGTMVEDVAIFAQFHMYRNAGRDEEAVI